MKIIFFGLGSIGQKHARLIMTYFGHELYAYRTFLSSHNDPSQFFKNNITLLADQNTILELKPDIAFITNPTDCHIQTALQCAQHGMHLFIEKPISHINLDVCKLINTVQDKNLLAYVAYPLVFHPAVEPLLSRTFLPTDNIVFVCNTSLGNWRMYKTYSASKDRGGGALLELSHELYLAERLLGRVLKIEGLIANESKEHTDAETYANLTLYHRSGCVSRVQLDINHWNEERYMMINGQKYSIDTGRYDEMFLDQLRYFFDAVDKKKKGLYVNEINTLDSCYPLFEKIINFRIEKRVKP